MGKYGNEKAYFDVFKASVLVDIAAGDSKISPEEIDAAGSNINMIGHGTAGVAEMVALYLLRSEVDLLIGTAEGDALEELVYDRFGLLRLSGNPATGEVRFSRPGVAAGAFTIPQYTQVQYGDNVYRTVIEVNFGAFDLTQDVDVQSVNVGVLQNIYDNPVTLDILDTLTDTTVTCASTEQITGGTDAESDDELRARARGYYQTLRRGTIQAIEYGAQQVPGVAIVTVEEVVNDSGQPVRWVKCYVGDQYGTASSTLIASVEAALIEYRAAGMYVEVIGAEVEYLTIYIDPVITAGANQAETLDQMKDAMVYYAAGLTAGETLSVLALGSAGLSVGNISIARDGITSDGSTPLADTAPTNANNVLRILKTGIKVV